MLKKLFYFLIMISMFSLFGHMASSSSFQPNKTESLCKKLDLQPLIIGESFIKSNKSHRTYVKEVIPLSNQDIYV